MYQKQKELQSRQKRSKASIEKISEKAVKELEEALGNEEALKEYLAFKAGFYRYSDHNTAMIKGQFPDATAVGSFQFWKKNGINVKKGENGIAILVPVRSKDKSEVTFETGYVFDISQTDADETKRAEILSGRQFQWKAGADHEAILQSIRNIADENRITLAVYRAMEEKQQENTNAGHSSVSMGDRSVLLDRDSSFEEYVKAAVSGLTEILVGQGADRSLAERKMQSEIAAFMVSTYYGLDTGENQFSFMELQEFKGVKTDRKKKLLGGAVKTADAIIEQMDVYLEGYRKIPGKHPVQNSGVNQPEADQRVSDVKEEDSEYVGNPGVKHRKEEDTVKGRRQRENDADVKKQERQTNSASQQYSAGKAAHSGVSRKVADTKSGRNHDSGIQDFGEKIGGARKDLWSEKGLNLDTLHILNDREAEQYVTKDNIWPRPDYIRMLNEGVPVHAAYFIKTVRNALPVRPEYSRLDTEPADIKKRQADYIEMVHDVRNLLADIRTDADICSFYNRFINMDKYIHRNENSVWLERTEKGYCVTNRMLRSMNQTFSTLSVMDRKIKKEQFGVKEDKKLPPGFQIGNVKQSEESGSYTVMKGAYTLAGGFKSREDAIKAARELGNSAASVRKKKFVPKQLKEIRRDGPSTGIMKDRHATGTMYMSEFGFRGGEFGNWMTETDRRASLDFGYEALRDLAAAVGIDRDVVSLGNHLSIAFGARGKGSAAAHYEPMRQVINLTKMRGAGSLAHEWGHAFDDIVGRRLGLNGFMSEHASSEKVPDSIKELMENMRYRPATERERQEHYEKKAGGALKNLDNWMQVVLPDIDLTKEQMGERERFKKELIAIAAESYEEKDECEVYEERMAGIKAKIEEIRDYSNKVTGHEIPADLREKLKYLALSVGDALEQNRTLRVETDFYRNSVKMDALCGKEDKGYWRSPAEMFARAFACYVKDQLPWRSDYLCGHAESAVTMDISKEPPEMVTAFPQGKEREALNKCFDKVFAECRERELLKESGNMEQNLTGKNEDFSYSARPAAGCRRMRNR